MNQEKTSGIMLCYVLDLEKQGKNILLILKI